MTRTNRTMFPRSFLSHPNTILSKAQASMYLNDSLWVFKVLKRDVKEKKTIFLTSA